MTLELSMYLLGGAIFVLTCLFGTVWGFMRQEAKDHALKLDQKVDNGRFHELEARFTKELDSVKENGEKLIDKLQSKHERELESMQSNFREQMQQIREQVRQTETNILNQMNLLFKANNSKE